jgi:hypothetical protein
MKFFSIQLLTAGIVVCVFLFSCKKKDPCEDVRCTNPYHICNNGVCSCPTGREGDSCHIYSYEKFLGNYNVTENCYNQQGNPPYYSNISKGFYNYEVIISNILGSGYNVKAVVDGIYISIPDQSFGSSRIVGEGTYQAINNRIQIQYEYNVNGVSRACTAFFQKI